MKSLARLITLANLFRTIALMLPALLPFAAHRALELYRAQQSDWIVLAAVVVFCAITPFLLWALARQEERAHS